MKLYKGNSWKLYHGSMLDMLEVISPESIDSIVTDPPYELNFMNKGWDNSGIAFNPDTWKKCYEVLKPGAYLLAFGGSRTYHRIACAIEDAGFEIRDTIMWLYGSGFPKSMNIGKAIESKLINGSANTQAFKQLNGRKEKSGNWGISKMAFEQGARHTDYTEDEHERVVDVDFQTKEGKTWRGWGTALKPSYEPIIVARKPCNGSCVDNVLEYGVGGINIDECRIGEPYKYQIKENGFGDNFMNDNWKPSGNEYEKEVNGRFPSNTILTYDETDFYEVCGGLPETKSSGGEMTMIDFSDAAKKNSVNKIAFNDGETAKRKNTSYIAPSDSGSAARYFYCAKASKRDREEGLEDFTTKIDCDRNVELNSANVPYNRSGNAKKNIHPTVKPTTLMQYLVRLVTPRGGVCP